MRTKTTRWVGSIAQGACLVACSQSVGAATTDEAPVSELTVTRAALESRPAKADILFVIDNSNSMAAEQAALRAEIPRLIDVLTTGQRFPDDPNPFAPFSDLHVGVVTTDMGIPGVNYPPCTADGGDDGRLLSAPRDLSDPTCEASYAHYQTLDESQPDPDKLAHDVSCVASVGTGGCGFEEQLEAPLKAIWPSVYRNASGNVITPNPLFFISTTQAGTFGRGDSPHELGGNAGFLRNDPDDPSVLLIVLITDEEDCSVARTDHLRPVNQLPEDSPYRAEDINLRCAKHPEFQYAVKERYYYGLRAAKPGQEDLVLFTAIVGVPPQLVNGAALAAVDFSDSSARDRFYDGILSAPEMQYAEDAKSGTGQGNLVPSCARITASGEVATAFPPRRIVSLAREFGEHGLVQSICQDDFAPALGHIVDLVSKPRTDP